MATEDEFLINAAKLACEHSAQAFRYLTTPVHTRYGTQSYETTLSFEPGEILLELDRLIREDERAKIAMAGR